MTSWYTFKRRTKSWATLNIVAYTNDRLIKKKNICTCSSHYECFRLSPLCLGTTNSSTIVTGGKTSMPALSSLIYSNPRFESSVCRVLRPQLMSFFMTLLSNGFASGCFSCLTTWGFSMSSSSSCWSALLNISTFSSSRRSPKRSCFSSDWTIISLS